MVAERGVAKIAQGCARDVDRAVAAAKRSMEEGPWSTMAATASGFSAREIAALVDSGAVVQAS